MPMKCFELRILYSSWPAVSTISVAKSCPLYLIVLLNCVLYRRVVAIDKVTVHICTAREDLPIPLLLRGVDNDNVCYVLPTDRLPTIATFLCFGDGISAVGAEFDIRL